MSSVSYALVLTLLFALVALTTYFIVTYKRTSAELSGAPGITGPTGPDATLSLAGPTGIVVGPTGPVTTQKPSSTIALIYPDGPPTSGAVQDKILYYVPLAAEPGFQMTVVNLNTSVFETWTSAPGYERTIIFKRPTSGADTWVKGTVIFSADFAYGSVANGGIFTVGYSLVSSPPLQNITRVGSLGFAVDGSASNDQTTSLTISFVASVPSGSTNVHFFSFLDFTENVIAPVGATFSSGYSMQIQLL